jgi:hypothetical protein
LSAAGARRVRNGEIAFIAACAILSRSDDGLPAHAILMDRARALSAGLPRPAVLMTGARFTELVFALHYYAEACAAVRRGPSGERNWVPAIEAQADLRLAVDRCLAVLGDRCFAVWAGTPAGRVAAEARS